MMEMMRDQIWQFVGVAISFMALVVAVLAIKFQVFKKSVSYFYTYDRPVFYIFNEELKDRIEISFDGKDVRRLTTFDVVFFNDGNVPVTPSDFVSPITIEFSQQIFVFGVSVTNSMPHNLVVNLSGSGLFYEIEPILMNPGDKFTVRFLIEVYEENVVLKPVVSSRIAGVKTFGFRRYGFDGYRLFYFLPYFYRAPFFIGVFVGGVVLWFFGRVFD